MKRFLVLFFFIVYTTLFSFESKFLLLSTNELEYNILKYPEEYPLKISTLVASGVKDVSNYLKKINNFESSISNQLISDKVENAKIIFKEMHRNFLKKYGEKYYYFQDLFEKGFFNCMSATMFYSILLEDFGYDFKGILLPTHIFTLLYVDGKEIDVENTSINGFDIRTNLQAQREFKRMTGFDYTRDSNKIEVIGKKDILATYYANIAALEIANKNYEKAFQYAIKSYIITTNVSIVKSNTMAIYSEYILYLDQKRDYEKALSVCEEGLNISKVFLDIYYYIIMNYISFLIDKGEYEKAYNLKNKDNLPLFVKEHYYFSLFEKVKNDYNKMYELTLEAYNELKDSKEVKKIIFNAMYMFIEKAYENEENFLRLYELVKGLKEAKNYIDDYYYTLLSKYYERKDFDKVLELYQRSRKYTREKDIDILAINSLNNKASKEIENENYYEAEKILSLAYEIDKKNHIATKNLLNFYRVIVKKMIYKKNYKNADNFLKNGLKYFPQDKQLLLYKEELKNLK